MNDINYEIEVKKVYPDAWVDNAGFGFGYVYIVSGEMPLSSAYASDSLAWKSVYNKLVKEGKI